MPFEINLHTPPSLKVLDINSDKSVGQGCGTSLTLFHLGAGMTLSQGGVFLTCFTFQPYNSVKSHANIQSLFPDKIFDIQTSFGTPISTVKEVWPSISVRQSWSLPVNRDFENRKNTIGSPLWNEKFFLSRISLKFFFRNPLTIKISNFVFFSKKFFFKIFPIFPNARGPPKNFDVQNFKFFGKKYQK